MSILPHTNPQKQVNNKKLSPHLRRQNFLLTFFQRPDHYEYKEVNGYILEKRLNDGVWEVAIYSAESWRKQRHIVFKKKSVRGTVRVE